MSKLGDATTRLVVLRGSSGSGKTTTAQEIRRRIGRGVAWIEQDYLRRILLREHDRAGAPNIGLIDQTARYALDHGYHVILEGILYSPAYGAMVRQLIADHAGATGVYYFQLPFDETLRRHSTRPLAKVITPEQMREWYQACDLLAGRAASQNRPVNRPETHHQDQDPGRVSGHPDLGGVSPRRPSRKRSIPGRPSAARSLASGQRARLGPCPRRPAPRKPSA